MWQTIAKRQHGVIAIAQLHACGLSEHDIDQLRRAGHLQADRGRRVLRAAAAFPTPMTECWSAVLNARAPLSHSSAAAAWGIDVPGDGRLHVTAAGRRRTRMPPGIRVHRVLLPEGAVVALEGLPVTERGRTMLDCVGLMRRREAITLFDRALQQNWISLRGVAQRLSMEPGRHGNTQLRWLLDHASEGEAVSERRLHDLLRMAAITGWTANVPVLGYSVDVAFEQLRLIIEVDGWAHHSKVERFQSDRQRQNILSNAGWTILRFTWFDLVENPATVVATVRAALQRLAQ